MNITFIYPKFEKLLESRLELESSEGAKKHLGDFIMPPALGIPIMTALSKNSHNIRLYDENIEQINYDDDADIVAVSFFTPQANYAYEIAKRFKAKGKTVIGGGMHASLMPDEASQFFDAICIGEVEAVWDQILSDFQKGQLKNIYKKEIPDIDIVPIPERRIFTGRNNYDWEAKLIQTMRGCSFYCENCIIPAEFGQNFRFKSIDKVLDELNASQISGDYYLIDDTLFLPNTECREYRTKLFKAFSELTVKPRIFISGSLNTSYDPAFLKLLKDSGVINLYLVTGCDPYSVKAFHKDQKQFFDHGVEFIDRYQQAGIEVYISVGLGFDYQDNSVFDISLDFIRKAKIRTAEFYILTPFPQTPVWHQFRKENRILHYNWTKYNTANVVFKPKIFTEQELLEGYIRCWKEFYSDVSIEESLNNFVK
ncbi:MAG: B12-binding domain-containing radical SAM protein [Bacteroidales bacterium]|nr:B12-binding domain-containing radical SAM protein [Bacteroidales bacterium]